MMDLEGALADLNAADMVKPENWYTLKNRGIVKKQLGDMEGAQNDLVASIMCKSKKSGQ
jgi:Flp pilus assembly protein TadD